MTPNCNTCRWYIYPLLTDNRLNTPQIPTVVPEVRYCSRGWCEWEGKEEHHENIG